MKKTVLFFLFAVLLNSCYVNHKLSVGKTLRIIDKSVYSFDTSEDARYIQYYSFNTYKNDFLAELKSRLKESNIVVVDTGVQITDYTLILTKMNFMEREESQTVNDSASGDNGQSFPIHVCTIKTETVLYDSKAVPVDKFSITNYSTEELTNSRTLFDYIFHTNKDYHNYRVKSLASNIFEYVARGSAKSTVKALVKKLDKK